MPMGPLALSAADEVLDNLIGQNRTVPKTTPDIVDYLFRCPPTMGKVPRETVLALVLATAIQRLSA